MAEPSTGIVTAGIDVGSSAVKLALVREATPGQPLVLSGRSERLRRRDALPVADALLDELLRETGIARGDLAYVATTGEGETITFRTGHFYTMTAHARGGLHLEPKARAVIDIGALHARAVLMDDRAKVQSYRMTSQCASGSGQFLENICRYLGVTIAEIGPLSLQSQNPESCSSICAVLAETDVINMVARGIAVPDILRGIHQSMAGRYLRLLASAGATDVVLVTGGLAADQGLMAALQDGARTQQPTIEVRTHPDSVLAGAIGAAIWGAFRARRRELQPAASRPVVSQPVASQPAAARPAE